MKEVGVLALTVATVLVVAGSNVRDDASMPVLSCDFDCQRCQRGCAQLGADCRASCVEKETACCNALRNHTTRPGTTCNCEGW